MRQVLLALSLAVQSLSGQTVPVGTHDSQEALGAPVVSMPLPTGPFAIGRVAFNWTDSSRTEQFEAASNARRSLMVYVWYPAEAPARPHYADYIPHLAALTHDLGDSLMRDEFGAAFAAIRSGSVRSHSLEAADFSPSLHAVPLLIFSHGFGESSLTYAAQLEDLASHGYVVAAIEHPYDAYAVWFPGNRVVRFAQAQWDSAKVLPKGAAAYQLAQVPIRTEDIRFVLDRLIETSRRSPREVPFASHLDLSRLGVFGHSLGGVAAASACRIDVRFKACVNEDADDDGRPFDGGFAARPIKQPFLFFATGHSIYVSKRTPQPSDADLVGMKLTRAAYDSIVNLYQHNQDEALRKMPNGYRIMAEAPDFVHRTFIDLKLLQTQSDSLALRQSHYSSLIRMYLLQFFDRTLREPKDPVLGTGVPLDSVITIDRFKYAGPTK
jgi:pimeloyl-ACP methyl ester carboxylesterase